MALQYLSVMVKEEEDQLAVFSFCPPGPSIRSVTDKEAIPEMLSNMLQLSLVVNEENDQLTGPSLGLLGLSLVWRKK